MEKVCACTVYTCSAADRVYIWCTIQREFEKEMLLVYMNTHCICKLYYGNAFLRSAMDKIGKNLKVSLQFCCFVRHFSA